MKDRGPVYGKTKMRTRNESGGMVAAEKKSGKLTPETLVQIYDLMVRARMLEERLIRMYKQNDGYFWIGGPGEEAFAIPLGLQVNKGQGVNHDFLHLHYRCSGTVLALGADPLGSIRQMKNVATDPYSGGRNFGNHYSIKKWNVVPVTSTIETQYATAIGTGIAQAKPGVEGITIVTGGDAGTAEGEFQSCLVWAARKGHELPILMIVTNNGWGISTSGEGQHPAGHTIAERGNPYGIKNAIVDGNDVEASWKAIRDAMEYVRRERKPFLLEARVSRLYGHSSASGANPAEGEVDCLAQFEARLEKEGVLARAQMDETRKKYYEEMLEYSKRVREEPKPDPSTIYDYTYHGQRGKYW